MRNNAQTGSKWFVCDRCGFDYPVQYRAYQNGLQVCTRLPCYDREVSQTRVIPVVDSPGVIDNGQSDPP